MPRARRNNDKNDHKNDIEEEDHLSVDTPIPHQNYCCISFLNPKTILLQKEFFTFYHYQKSINKKLTELMDKSLLDLINTSTDGNIDVADVIKIKKNVTTICKEQSVEFVDFKSKFEDFMFSDAEQIGDEFDAINSFKTSVIGVKVRGCFDKIEDARVRARNLQQADPMFDVYVADMFMWLPFDVMPDKIADVEHLNSDLNKLCKEYAKNQTNKNSFYNEQKTNRQKDALSTEDRMKHQAGLTDMRNYQEKAKEQKAKEQENKPLNNMDNIFNENPDNKPDNNITQSIVTGNSQDKEITIEQQTTILESDDPWLQRMNK